MEDTLRELRRLGKKSLGTSLNPYYNGRYSPSMKTFNELIRILRLNPYYNGRYSPSIRLLQIWITLQLVS